MTKTKIIVITTVIVAVTALIAVVAYFLYMRYTATAAAAKFQPQALVTQSDKNIAAFLRVIREGESSQGPEAYHTQFGGAYIADLSKHPRQVITVTTVGGKMLKSDAFGAYQILSTTWDMIVKNLGLTDMLPDSQDKAAVWLIAYRGAYDAVCKGDFITAVNKCRNEWASLPGSTYGQPTQQLADALEVFLQYGGVSIQTA